MYPKQEVTPLLEVRIISITAETPKAVVQKISILPAHKDSPDMWEFRWPNRNAALMSDYAIQKLLEGSITFVRCGKVYQCQLEEFVSLMGAQSEIKASWNEEPSLEDVAQ